MSYYYNYYVGYKDPKGKYHAFGPYNSLGDLCPVLSRSSSCASDLHDEFNAVTLEDIDDDLKKRFGFTDWHGKAVSGLKALPVSDLPSGSYIRKGYFLIEDVDRFETDGSNYDPFDSLFYEYLTPVAYAALADNQARFGRKPKEKEEPEGYNAEDYMYYAFPDYYCKEYEAEALRNAVDMLENYKFSLEGNTPVILLSEG